MNIETTVFIGSPAYQFELPSHNLFGGLHRWLQSSPFNSTAIPYLILACIILIFLQPRTPRARLIFLPSVVLLNLLTTLRISAGWDEFYINLKHSWVLKHFSTYSFNMFSKGEATVDFLPYFLAGLLGKFGVPLQEAVISINLLGNILFLILVYKILKIFSFNERLCMTAVLLSAFFPCFIVVGATGFTAGLFSSIILLGFYFFISQKPFHALVALAILPLIRVEGILFNFLYWLVIVLPFTKSITDSAFIFIKRSVQAGLILAGPFFLLSFWRFFYFGSFMPNPVVFKNTGFTSDYLRAGLSQFQEGLRYFEILTLVGVVLISLLIRKCLRLPKSNKEYILLKFWIISTLFILSYHTGGGDWFPIIWGRYTLPSHMFSWLAFLLAIAVTLTNLKSWRLYVGIFISAAILGTLSRSGAYKQALHEVKSPGLRWERIDSLASLGQMFKLTSENSAIISSPEVATMMYFAERDLLDLLGVANPDVANSPLNPITPGNLLHRKRNPQTIYKNRPTFIAFWGCDNPVDFDYTQADDKQLQAFIEKNSLNGGMLNIATYRGGSLENLISIGYKNVTVFIGNRMFNYFVLKEDYLTHVTKLRSLGIDSEKVFSVAYQTPKSFLEIFPDPNYE